MNVLRTLALAAMALFPLAGFAAGQGRSLLPNGGFEQAADNGAGPAGWGLVPGATWETENGNHFLRLTSREPGASVILYLAVPVTPDQKAMALSFKVRYDGIKTGSKSWFDGRIMMNFKDAQKKVVGSPSAPYFRGTSKEWKERTVKFRVPEGATTLEIMPCMLQAVAGTLDLDDLRLEAIDPATLPKLIPMDSPVVPAPAADKLPGELHVAGNQLQTADGKSVWLQGLCVDSLQWSVSGDRIVPSIQVAVDQWKANIIRLPVTEEKWFGQNESQEDGGARYRQIIDSAVNTAAGRGAYIVIDLHRFRAPTAEHVKFWKAVAATYKNHPAVLFELFNEPHDLTWDVWRNGGSVTDKVKAKEGVAAENADALKSFQAVGMQELVDAVRGTGAKNIIIAGGLDWGYDLWGVMNGYELKDAVGNGIMYSSHIYPWKRDWAGKTLIAAGKHPLFIGEVGNINKWEDFSFIPLSARHEPVGPASAWPGDMLGMIQKYKLNWTGFSFHPRCGPMVIEDWDYKPTPYWGVFVRDALAGKQFEMKKMR